MPLRIATNIQALSAQRFMGTNNESQNRSLEKLSSGSRINRAGDDAAGLAISEKMKASIRSIKQASRNANDGISMIQTAEGSMNEISNIMVRLRELSIQGSSDTISDVERGFIDKEIQGLKKEVDRIASVTEFNGTRLLNGGRETPIEIQIGINNNPTEDRFTYDTKELNTTLAALGLNEIGTLTRESSQQNMALIDKAIIHLNENRASLGALQNRLNSSINNMGIYRENIESANSRIRDTDMAEETSELAKSNILNQSSLAVLSQANQTPAMALKLLG